jgi:hypothetical protein
MGKLGGIILLAALALSGCAAPPVAVEPASMSSHRVTTDQLHTPESEFIAAVKASESSYANLPASTLTGMGKEICEHYADGFTTEHLRASDGERLAIVGEAARATVCVTP